MIAIAGYVGLVALRRQGASPMGNPPCSNGPGLCQDASTPDALPPDHGCCLGCSVGPRRARSQALPLCRTQALEQVALPGSQMCAHDIVLAELGEAHVLVGRLDEARRAERTPPRLSPCTHTGHGHQAYACASAWRHCFSAARSPESTGAQLTTTRLWSWLSATPDAPAPGPLPSGSGQAVCHDQSGGRARPR